MCREIIYVLNLTRKPEAVTCPRKSTKLHHHESTLRFCVCPPHRVRVILGCSGAVICECMNMMELTDGTRQIRGKIRFAVRNISNAYAECLLSILTCREKLTQRVSTESAHVTKSDTV
jgi:hypothetical protein